MQVFPSAQYYKRAGFPLKKICQYAAARGFTDVLVANEDRKSVNGLLLIHLPGGPTAHFRLSKLVLSKDIKVGAHILFRPLKFCGISLECMHAHRPAGVSRTAASTAGNQSRHFRCRLQGHGRATSHKPELILSGFGTRLGHRISRVFAALFAQVTSRNSAGRGCSWRSAEQCSILRSPIWNEAVCDCMCRSVCRIQHTGGGGWSPSTISGTSYSSGEIQQGRCCTDLQTPRNAGWPQMLCSPG